MWPACRGIPGDLRGCARLRAAAGELIATRRRAAGALICRHRSCRRRRALRWSATTGPDVILRRIRPRSSPRRLLAGGSRLQTVGAWERQTTAGPTSRLLRFITRGHMHRCWVTFYRSCTRFARTCSTPVLPRSCEWRWQVHFFFLPRIYVMQWTVRRCAHWLPPTAVTHLRARWSKQCRLHIRCFVYKVHDCRFTYSPCFLHKQARIKSVKSDWRPN